MLGLAVLTATALAAMAVPASAAWTEQRLPGAAGLYVQPHVAANARGDAAVVWGARPHRFLAVRPAGRARFGPPIALPDRGKADRVAVLSDGTVLVGWLSLDGTARSGPGVRECCLVAYLQRLRPGSRRLSAPRAVTTRGIDLYGWSLVAGPGGRVALIGNSIEPVAGIYGGKRGAITLVTSRPGGSFGTPIKTTASAWQHRSPFVGFGGDGRGRALWFEDAPTRLIGAQLARNGRLSASRTNVLTNVGGFLGFDAGLDQRSHTTVIWASQPPTAPFSTQIAVASTDIGGGLTSPQVLDSSRAASDAFVDVAPSGRAIAVWSRYDERGQELTGLAIRRSARGRFRVLAPLAGPSKGVGVTLSSGDGVVVHGSRSLVARPVAPDGEIGPIRRLGGAAFGLGGAAVDAVAAAGRVTLAWGRADGLRIATYRP